MIWRWIFTQPYLSGGVSRTLLTNYKLKWKPKLILDTKAKTTIHNRRIFVNTFPCYIGKALMLQPRMLFTTAVAIVGTGFIRMFDPE